MGRGTGALARRLLHQVFKAIYNKNKGKPKKKSSSTKKKKATLDIPGEEFMALVTTEQMRVLSVEEGLWGLCALGTPEEVEECIEKFESKGAATVTLTIPIENSRDAMGANPIHVAYLFENYAVGRYLVQKYPFAALEGCSEVLSASYSIETTETREKLRHYSGFPMPYGGLTILHLAILHQAMDEIQWILEFYKCIDESLVKTPPFFDPVTKEWFNPVRRLHKILRSRVNGRFFKFGTDFGIYSGDTALHFAVASDNLQMVQQLLSFMETDILDDLFTVDRYGNNVLHLCVLNTLPHMFSFLVEKAREIIKSKCAKTLPDYEALGDEVEVVEKTLLRHLLTHVLNNDGHSPFTLAAATGDVTMFRLHFGTLEDEVAPAGSGKTNRLTQLRERLVGYQQELLELTVAAEKRNASEKEFPLEMAAPERQSVVQGLMKHQRWSMAVVSCSLLELDGLDVPHEPDQRKFLREKDAFRFDTVVATFSFDQPDEDDKKYSSGETFKELPGLRSAMEWITIGDADTLHMFEIDEIKALLEAKWNSFGSSNYKRSFFFAVTFAILLTSTTILQYNNDAGFLTAAILAVIALGFQVLEEFKVIYFTGSNYFSPENLPHGAGLFKRCCLFMIVFCFIIAVVSNRSLSVRDVQRPAHDMRSDASVFSMSIGLLFSWLYMFFFFIGYEYCILVTLGIRCIDCLFKFMVPFATVMVGFGVPLSVLNSFYNSYDNSAFASGYNPGVRAFTSLLHNFYTLSVGICSGNFAMLDETMVRSGSLWIAVLLSIGFVIFAASLLYNLFVSVLRVSYEEFMKECETVFTRERLNILLSYEKSWSQNERESNRAKYTIDYDHDWSSYNHGPYLEIIAKHY